MALVQPWRDFISRGLVETLSVEFKPGGMTVSVTLADEVPLPDGQKARKIPPGRAKEIIMASGLAPKPGGRGRVATSKEAAQPLPKRSLCTEDFEDNNTFLERVKAVAKAIGSASASGRIGSLGLAVSGLSTFEEWWEEASPDTRVRLLTDQKHYEQLSSSQKKKGELIQRSPFRGTVPTPKEEGHPEEEEEEEKPSPTSSQKGSREVIVFKKKGRGKK
jgi:hypothetical protein